MNSQAKRPDVSWEIIEHEYVEGTKSVREIGREHNISEGAIRQHASKQGWKRKKDLPDPDRKLNDPRKGKNNLTPKQTILVEEYLKEPIASKAGEKAGLNARYAQDQVLRNPAVALAIAEGRSKAAERAGLDHDYILARLMQVVERCLQVEAVFMQDGNRLMIETPTGEVAAAFKFESAGANRALELLGKHMKLFTDAVVEHEHTHEHTIIPASDIRDEIEEMFSGPSRLPAPNPRTEH